MLFSKMWLISSSILEPANFIILHFHNNRLSLLEGMVFLLPIACISIFKNLLKIQKKIFL